MIPMTNPRRTSMATSVRPRGGHNGRRSVGGGAMSGGREKGSGSVLVAGPHQSGGGGPPPGTPAVGGDEAVAASLEPGPTMAPWVGSSGKAWAVQAEPSQNLRWPLYQGSGYQPGGACTPLDPPASSLAIWVSLRPSSESHLSVA
jgi:hypothetical protein